jgi:cell division protein FtsB
LCAILKSMKKIRDGQLAPFFVKIGSVLLIFYVLFLLGRSIWTNYDLRQSIKTLNDQIVTLRDQKKDLSNLNLYYGSESFKELEARRKLGYQKPDEKVVIIGTTAGINNFEQELTADRTQITEKKVEDTTANWLVWLDYFTRPVEK